jgi:ribose-phosphate pyrophosphokinase
MDELKVFGCNASKEFAREICNNLNIPLGESEAFKFDNDNTFVKILETVRGDDVFVVQSSVPPVDESLMELLITIDALKRASAKRITAILPYYPYARSDKKDQPRIAITSKLVADLLAASGANRVLTSDLHATQILGFFNIPADQLIFADLLANYFKKMNFEDLVVVATDAGSSKKAYKYAMRLNAPIAMLDKRRLGNSQETLIENIVGDVTGKRCVIFDDEIDRGSSIINAVKVLEEYKVKEIYAACTHAVLSGPAIDRIKNSSIKELVITNTIPLPPSKQIDKIKVLTVAPTFAEAIKRIHEGHSMGEMFY